MSRDDSDSDDEMPGLLPGSESESDSDYMPELSTVVAMSREDSDSDEMPGLRTVGCTDSNTDDDVPGLLSGSESMVRGTVHVHVGSYSYTCTARTGLIVPHSTW